MLQVLQLQQVLRVQMVLQVLIGPQVLQVQTVVQAHLPQQVEQVAHLVLQDGVAQTVLQVQMVLLQV